MLNGTSFYTDDIVWAGILSDLGATAVARDVADIVFVAPPATPLSALDLKSYILAEIDAERANATGGFASRRTRPHAPTDSQKKIITLLTRAGTAGIDANDLAAAHGIAPDANSHAMDTMIYNIRKSFGADFIKTAGGRYYIGKV